VFGVVLFLALDIRNEIGQPVAVHECDHEYTNGGVPAQ
jgi:hypothetical protein